jgi:hypothetical protein
MDADGTLMEQPSSRLEPQRHRDHGASPFLVVDLPKDPFLFPLPFSLLPSPFSLFPLRLCVFA